MNSFWGAMSPTTGLSSQDPRWCFVQWWETWGTSSTIHWLFPTLSAHSACLGRFATVWCNWSARAPHISVLTIVPHTTGTLPAWPAWLQLAFHSYNNLEMQCPWVGSPLDHKTIYMSQLFPGDLRHHKPTDPEIITLIFPVKIYLLLAAWSTIVAMLFGNLTLGCVRTYKVDFYGQLLCPGSDVLPLLAQMGLPLCCQLAFFSSFQTGQKGVCYHPQVSLEVESWPLLSFDNI